MSKAKQHLSPHSDSHLMSKSIGTNSNGSDLHSSGLKYPAVQR